MKPIIRDLLRWSSVSESTMKHQPSSKQKMVKSAGNKNTNKRFNRKPEPRKHSRVINVWKPPTPPPVQRLHSQKKTHKPARVSVREPADKERSSWGKNRTPSRTPGPGSDERIKPVSARGSASCLFIISWFFSCFSFFIQTAWKGAFTEHGGGAVCRGSAHRWPGTEVDRKPPLHQWLIKSCHLLKVGWTRLKLPFKKLCFI